MSHIFSYEISIGTEWLAPKVDALRKTDGAPKADALGIAIEDLGAMRDGRARVRTVDDLL